jgi:predicted signal transduction protein with EAL and GGDEF domain
LRPQDKAFVGHEGEWLLLLADVTSMAQPALAASHIHRVFDHPVRLLAGGVSLEVSIGIALPDHGNAAGAAVQVGAPGALGREGEGRAFSWFEAEQGQDWQQYSAMVEELREAIELEHLELFLQPQVDLASNRAPVPNCCCAGSANGEWVPPPQIVEMVEQNGWRPLLTDWLIRAAIRAAAELEEAGIRIHLSLNLVAGDLLDIELPDIFAQRLAAWHERRPFHPSN